MNRFFDWLRPKNLSEEDEQIIDLLIYIVVFLFIVSFSGAISQVFSGYVERIILWGGIAVISLVGLYSIRQGMLAFVKYLIPSILLAATFIGMFLGKGANDVGILGIPLTIIIANFLIGPRGGLVFTVMGAAGALTILILDVNRVFGEISANPDLNDIFPLGIAILLLGVLQYMLTSRFNQYLQKVRENEEMLTSTVDALEESQATLEQRVGERTAQLRASIEVGRAISSILDPDELIGNVVNLISKEFGYYYASIFLLTDTGDTAILRSASGDAGQKLLDANHNLEVRGRSMVGACIRSRSPRIAFDVGEEPVRFDNPLLPYTRSEIALPLLAGNRIIGAMDVQSMDAAAFTPQDIETLQGLANQVAVALENAQLFQNSSEQLEEINRLNQTYLQESWRSFSVGSVPGYRYSGGRTRKEKGTPSQETAPVSKEIQILQENGHSSIAAPLVLRDQVIGVIHLRDTNRNWTVDELAMIEAVTRQTSLALENAQLLQSSQRQATQERLVGQITNRMQEALDVETVIQIAAREMQKMLSLTEVEVRLGVEQDHSTKENG